MTKLSDILLSLAQAPGTGNRLEQAPTEWIEKINEAISRRAVVDATGECLDKPIEAGLLDVQEQRVFPVRGGVVIMVSNRAIPLLQLSTDSHA